VEAEVKAALPQHLAPLDVGVDGRAEVLVVDLEEGVGAQKDDEEDDSRGDVEDDETDAVVDGKGALKGFDGEAEVAEDLHVAEGCERELSGGWGK
jgi:hypothetical protein